MGSVPDARSARIVGRVRERELLREAVVRAAAHQPCAVFVQGEAGVGKTRLVSDLCGTAEERGFTVLWGSCVRFGAATAPYAPVVSALEHWLSANAAGGLPADVLACADDLGALLPSVDRTAEGGDATPRLVTIIDRLIGRICANQPVVLVVDDVHWADVTSLDVLAYLVTGFHRQRLLMVTTSRTRRSESAIRCTAGWPTSPAARGYRTPAGTVRPRRHRNPDRGPVRTGSGSWPCRGRVRHLSRQRVLH